MLEAAVVCQRLCWLLCCLIKRCNWGFFFLEGLYWQRTSQLNPATMCPFWHLFWNMPSHMQFWGCINLLLCPPPPPRTQKTCQTVCIQKHTKNKHMSLHQICVQENNDWHVVRSQIGLVCPIKLKDHIPEALQVHFSSHTGTNTRRGGKGGATCWFSLKVSGAWMPLRGSWGCLRAAPPVFSKQTHTRCLQLSTTTLIHCLKYK